jgi:putative membrane protein
MTGGALRARRSRLLRGAAAAAAIAALACVWLTPLTASLPGPFSAHMVTHMTVVAFAAPLLALALAGTALDPLRRLPAALLAVPASLVELLVVWSWHAPALHEFARRSSAGFAAEQATFLASALVVWLCVAAPDRRAAPRVEEDRRGSESGSTSAAGGVALLLTSMHMTLLGALLALAPRPLYHAHAAAALADQHLGGALMLSIGGVVYLAGGLVLAATLVRQHAPAQVGLGAPGIRS